MGKFIHILVPDFFKSVFLDMTLTTGWKIASMGQIHIFKLFNVFTFLCYSYIEENYYQAAGIRIWRKMGFSTS